MMNSLEKNHAGAMQRETSGFYGPYPMTRESSGTAGTAGHTHSRHAFDGRWLDCSMCLPLVPGRPVRLPGFDKPFEGLTDGLVGQDALAGFIVAFMLEKGIRVDRADYSEDPFAIRLGRNDIQETRFARFAATLKRRISCASQLFASAF